MPAGLGGMLMKAKKKKAEESRAKYRQAVEQAKANAPVPIDLDDDKIHKDRDSRPALTSIWQTTNMDDFLAIASERESGFAAERNVRVVVDGTTHVVNDSKIQPLSDTSKDWFALSDELKIPTRPEWSYDMTADDIQTNEKRAFLDWRRALAQVEEKEQIVMTPYEKNLEVWRQLWRVVERSDVILELVDARNPLAFRSQHFEKYVAEHKNTHKVTKQLYLLLNKADLLTEDQRKIWAEYLTGRGFKFFFFSASENLAEQAELVKKLQEEGVDLEAYAKRQEAEAAKYHGDSDVDSDDSDQLMEHEDIIRSTKPAPKPEPKKKRRTKHSLRGNATTLENTYDIYTANVKSKEQIEKEAKLQAEKEALKFHKVNATAEEVERDERVRTNKVEEHKPWDVLSPESLLDQMALLRPTMKVTDRNVPLTVGMIGYPNVGKSSTINAIIGSKKVVVSATPGKTKHFQTLTIPNERRVMLCDCPGLVFPSFAATRNTMICDGVLPIDTVKDYVTPISLIAQRIPQIVFERLYKINVHMELDQDDSTNDADLLLNLVARRKGYMTEHDKPYRAKAAKEILKMYVDGGIIYVHPPPGYEASEEMKRMYHTDDVVEKSREEGHDEGEDGGSALSDDGDDDWEDIDSASDARGISDDEDDMEGIRYAGQRKSKKVVEDDSLKPRTFLTRPAMVSSHIDTDAEDAREAVEVSRFEAFNLQSNVHLLNSEHVKRRQTKKRLNHQLEPDMTVMITEDGKKELLIDSDDGIVECENHHDYIQRPKRQSKRQIRREEKKAGSRKMRVPAE